jgi:hypothetical protein
MMLAAQHLTPRRRVVPTGPRDVFFDDALARYMAPLPAPKRFALTGVRAAFGVE